MMSLCSMHDEHIDNEQSMTENGLINFMIKLK